MPKKRLKLMWKWLKNAFWTNSTGWGKHKHEPVKHKFSAPCSSDKTRQLSAPINMTEQRKFWEIKFSEKWEFFPVEYNTSIIVPCQYFCIIPELWAVAKMARKIRGKFFEIWCEKEKNSVTDILDNFVIAKWTIGHSV